MERQGRYHSPVTPPARKVNLMPLRTPPMLAAAVVLAAISCLPAAAQTPNPPLSCPPNGWEENLVNYTGPNDPFPINDTASVNAPDCNFHEWSWEAFVWATAMVQDPNSGTLVPRFLTLQAPDQLLPETKTAAAPKKRVLRLAARAQVFHGTAGFTTGAGAIVEADGNMLVAPNGYPVYASVHMNAPYFATAKANLIVTGGYQAGDPNATFPTGSAVFKATWLRLAPGQAAPAGAYTTQAEVPVLQTKLSPGQVTIQPVSGRFETVTVALVGLHVVGATVNHPEFLWGTFEHKLNSPATPDNTFVPSPTTSDPNNYTFYRANTPYSQVNIAVDPPQLSLNANTQTLTPITNVVLQNQTGGENLPGGPANIKSVNTSGQNFLLNRSGPQSTFGNYFLVGTVWMAPNSYNLNSGQSNAIGSVNLANSTAETFVQVSAPSVPAVLGAVTNCFGCHNPTSYSFQTPPPAKLKNRLVALSHVLAIGSVYEVPNSISGNLQLVPIKPAK